MILVTLAGLVVVGGFVGLSVLSTTDPESAAESTSTPSTTPRSTTSTFDLDSFTVADIALGEPLQWGQVMAIDDGYPVSLLEHAGNWFLFSSEADGGLRAWRSGTGVDWSPLGQVIGVEHPIDIGVVSGGRELITIETDDSGGTFLWRSDNGADWTADQIEIESAGGSTALFPHTIGGNGEIFLISGSTGSGPDAVSKRLKAAVGDLVDIDDYGWIPSVVGEKVTITVHGPLGIRLVTYSAEELGLTAPEREQIIREYSGVRQTALLWRSTDGVAWEGTEIEGVEWIDSIATTPDGRLLVTGYGPSGPRLYTSADGIVWEPSSDVLQPYAVQTWGDLLVGPAGGTKPSVMVSADAELWENVGPVAVFPDGIQWHVEALGSGPGGIASQITGWADSHPPEPGDTVTLLADNGAEVSLYFDGSIRLTSPGGGDHLWTSGLTEDDAHADPATGEMVFTDRETGEELARFGLEELRDAENEFWAGQSAPRSFDAFVFTPDGSSWTIQKIEEVAADSYIQWLEVTDSHVVAVRVADDFDPDSNGGFEVWAAEIP